MSGSCSAAAAAASCNSRVFLASASAALGSERKLTCCLSVTGLFACLWLECHGNGVVTCGRLPALQWVYVLFSI